MGKYLFNVVGPLIFFLIVAIAVVGISSPPFMLRFCNCDDDGGGAMESMKRFQRVSDFLIALAYFSIPLELLYFISCSEGFPFWWVVAQFGAFIVLCGLTHFVAVWTYVPHSFNIMFTQTILKVLTALVSCATAISLVHMIPMLLHVKVRESLLMNKAEELNREVNIIKRQEEAGRHVHMLTHEIRRSVDKHTILSIMLEQLGRTLNLENCSIWMPDSQGLTIELTHELKRRDFQEPVLVFADDELVKTIENSTKAVVVPPDSLLGRACNHSAATMGSTVAVRLPLLRYSNFGTDTKERTDTKYAIMVLGFPKGSGWGWGPNELDIVEAVADQVAVALSHAAILEDSHRIQEQLVEKNKALEQVRRDAETAMLARNEFLIVMNHEMRIPLHTIRALASLLQESDLNIEQQAVVRTVEKSSGLMSMVINDMQNFSNLDNSSMVLDLRPFDLPSFFKEVANFAIPMARSKGLTFSLEISTSLPQYVIGDEKRFLQLILNLISTVIRFTSAQGSVTVAVCVDTKEGFRWDPRKPTWMPIPDGSVHVRTEVRNTGFNGGEWDFLKVLHRFSQVENAASDQYHNGIWRQLLICEKIAKLMNGHTWVQNGGVGLTNSVVACIVCLELPSPSVDSTLPTPEETIYNEDLKGLKVLLADDNLINRIVTKQVLEKLGCQATVVESGRQCLATLAQPGTMYNILLLDLWMPDMDGYDVALRIKKNIHPERRPLVVALTADTDEHSQERCLKVGMEGVILKPVSIAEMSNKLCEILRGSKAWYNVMR